ncbi:hypothetical protein Dimus_011155, partial [Dionaea muscipula]
MEQRWADDDGVLLLRSGRRWQDGQVESAQRQQVGGALISSVSAWSVDDGRWTDSDDESAEEIPCGIDQQTSNNDEVSIDAASIDAGFGVSAAPPDAVPDEPDVPLNSSTLPTSVDSIVGGSSTAA